MVCELPQANIKGSTKMDRRKTMRMISVGRVILFSFALLSHAERLRKSPHRTWLFLPPGGRPTWSIGERELQNWPCSLELGASGLVLTYIYYRPTLGEVWCQEAGLPIASLTDRRTERALKGENSVFTEYG